MPALVQIQRLQMLAMSKTDVGPGATETQQLRVMVPAAGVSSPFSFVFGERLLMPWRAQSLVRLRLRIAYSVGGAAKQNQVDFAFPPGLMA